MDVEEVKEQDNTNVIPEELIEGCVDITSEQNGGVKKVITIPLILISGYDDFSQRHGNLQ